MAWKFPERIPRTGEVVDNRDLNEAIQPFVEEDGRLNEQNWSSSMAVTVTRADLAVDASFRVLHKHNTIDASDTDAGSPFSVEASQTWEPLLMDGTNTEYSLSSRGGTLVVIASLQMGLQGNPGAWGDGTAYLDGAREEVVHGLFGIRLDGALLPISVVGDQDTSSEGENMETGLSGYLQGIDIEISVPVTPGRHTVEIVAKSEALASASDQVAILIYSTELLVWEIR
tara:strand:+ start:250 stop:933 length:684 start_codon:yes stop_codon:yes gene_type:complete